LEENKDTKEEFCTALSTLDDFFEDFFEIEASYYPDTKLEYNSIKNQPPAAALF